MSPDALPIRVEGTLSEDREVIFTFDGAWTPADLPTLSAGGVELEPSVRGGRLCWRWSPEFRAGEVVLTFRHGGTETSHALDVDPNLAKLTRADYAALTAKLVQHTRRLFALSPVQIRGRHEHQAATTLAQVQFLRACFERLSRAVREIARSPKKRLQEVPTVVPLALADVATPASLASVLAHGNLDRVSAGVHLPGSVAELAERLRGHLPRTVVSAERVVTFDVPENRFVKHALERISGLLRHAAQRVDALEGDRDVSVREVARAYGPVVEQMRRETFDLLRLPVFDQVRAEEVESNALVTFKRRPDYRTVADIYRELSNGLTPAAGGAVSVPVDRTYRLYELWTSIEVVLALVAAFRDDHEDLSELVSWLSEDVSLASLDDREVQVVVSSSVWVRLQRTFQRRRKEDLGTYSHEMRPDLVIEVSPGGEAPAVLILLDAKYRRAGLRDGLNDLHRYKDAIVDRDLRRVVRGAYALAPGLADLPADFADPAWQDRHGFGIVAAHPSDPTWTKRVVEIVRGALAPAQRQNRVEP